MGCFCLIYTFYSSELKPILALVEVFNTAKQASPAAEELLPTVTSIKALFVGVTVKAMEKPVADLVVDAAASKSLMLAASNVGTDLKGTGRSIKTFPTVELSQTPQPNA